MSPSTCEISETGYSSTGTETHDLSSDLHRQQLEHPLEQIPERLPKHELEQLPEHLREGINNTSNTSTLFPHHNCDSDGTISHVSKSRDALDESRDDIQSLANGDKEAPKDISLHSSRSRSVLESVEIPFARLMLTIVVLSLALFIAAIDQTIVATATVRISEEFKSLSLAPWLANAYLLSSTALQPSTGRLSDIFGRTQLLLSGLLVFAAGSLICAVAQSMPMLLAGRAVAGAGAASIIGLTLVIVADIVPMRNRGPYMAIFSLVFSVSSVVGPLLGGVFVDKVSWRWIFWLSEPITGFVIAA
ncbi:hypothetical protein LPJ59_006647, partial [Coemansia sp. RSA 2399]